MKLASPSSLATLKQLAGVTSSSRTSQVSSTDIDLLVKYVEEEHRVAKTNPKRKRNRTMMALNSERVKKDKEAMLKL
jgi:hypothetical protein